MVSPKQLQTIAAYVPTPVARAIYSRPRLPTQAIAQRFPAAVLLTDISGFTPLSERLAQAGPTGAEELTQLINLYFSQMIQIIETFHGQVIKFSGDAIIVLFPAQAVALETAVRQAGECALAMQAKVGNFTNLQTSQGRAALSMKVGVGAGQVLACSIGGIDGRWEYLAAGDPLVQVARAEALASPGQIIFSPAAWQLAKTYFKGQPAAPRRQFVRLYQTITRLPPQKPAALDWTALSPAHQTAAQSALEAYLPGAIRARLDEQADWLSELRRMTILFVGIGGLDYDAPNVVSRLQEFLQATQELIVRFEGALGKVTVDDKGTVLLVLFGVPPVSHEDDAARAVAFALRLQTVADSLKLRMSIGISEGQIFAGLVGAPGRREYTVIGDEVNLAARLMQYGRAGAIVVSKRVQERAGAHFLTDSLGQISLKGKSATVAAFVVKGEQETQDRFMSRYLLHEDPFVGRKGPLEQTRRVAARVQAGSSQILLVEGELGQGKTRLVSEMVREWVAEGGVGYGSKCISYGQQTPYQGWREILTAMFGLTPGLPPRRRLARLAIGVAELDDPPDQPGYWELRLPLLADVLGLDIPPNNFTRHISGELRRDNTFRLVEALLQRHTARHPLLVVLEDIHWADELSLALVNFLARQCAGIPLLLAVTYRHPGAEAITPTLDALQQLPHAHTVYLEPLPREESIDLVKITLGDVPLPPNALELLLNQGQGNPFFLLEISRAVRDVLPRQVDPGGAALTPLNLPDTVHDAIFMHVDRLPEDAKLTLKVASVIGVKFQRPLLSAVHPMPQGLAMLPAQLTGLEQEKLIRMETPEPKWEYVFRNVITQEIVYEGLLLAQRRQLHAAVAAALENNAPDEIENLAYHYSRTDNLEMALHYLQIAGQKAGREYANMTAIGYYSQILDLLAVSGAQPARQITTTDYWDVLLERTRLYELTGQRDRAVEDLGTLGLIAEALNDNRRRALAAQQWVLHYETGGDYASALEVVERFVTLAHQATDEKLAGEGYNQWGRLLYIRRDFENAQRHLQKALQIAQKYQDHSAQAECLTNLGQVAHYQFDYDVALYFFEEAVELWRDLGHQFGLSNGLRYLGQVYYDTGQFTPALHCFQESLALHRLIGDPHGEALTMAAFGRLHRALGSHVQAKTMFTQALLTHQSTGDRHAELFTLVHIGWLHHQQEEDEVALATLAQAIQILQKEIDDPWLLGKALTYYGAVLISLKQPNKAQTHIREAMRIQSSFDRVNVQIESAIYLGCAAMERGDASLAQACVRQSLAYMARHGIAGIEHPLAVYWHSYKILEAYRQTDQARAVLKQARQYIAAQSALIADPPLRQSYLTNVTEVKQLQAVSQ